MQINFTVDGSRFSEKLKAAEENTSREVNLAVVDSLTIIRNEARQIHIFQNRTGAAEEAIVSEMTGKNKGRVFLNDKRTLVARFQHDGTGLYGPNNRQYQIIPHNAKALHFVSGGQEFFSKRVTANGIPPDQFLYRAAANKKASVIARIARGFAEAFRKAGLK
jgi:hypothetical protein